MRTTAPPPKLESATKRLWNRLKEAIELGLSLAVVGRIQTCTAKIEASVGRKQSTESGKGESYSWPLFL
ncbi:hypothetical protein V1291_003993 [Nitrobacteraceae bacterium AZCC 1564]